jgi:hypothetical protein
MAFIVIAYLVVAFLVVPVWTILRPNTHQVIPRTGYSRWYSAEVATARQQSKAFTSQNTTFGVCRFSCRRLSWFRRSKMSSINTILTLDRPATYRVEVSGHVESGWTDWVGATAMRTTDPTGNPVSVITGSFDQAALHGLLRRLYSLGFPLISVRWIADCPPGTRGNH